MVKRSAILAMLACLLVGLLLASSGQAAAQTVRAVMHAEVKHLDPHWTTADISQVHGFMVYDTLFAMDEKEHPQPQMVDTYRSPRATRALEELGNLSPGTDAFKKTLTEYHTALMENIPYVPLGELFLYAAYRKDHLGNIVETPHTVFWNMVKK